MFTTLTSNKRAAIFVFTAVLALVASACASDDPVAEEETTVTTMEDTTVTTMEDMEDMEEQGDEDHADFEFGEPADASSADRVIEIAASDTFTFEPAEITVAVGETVTFRVTDTGAIPHDFTLGDEVVQDEHEAEMVEMGGQMEMHDEPNLLSMQPGETKEMTWTFTEAGQILMGCHQSGHYAAGMLGTISIES